MKPNTKLYLKTHRAFTMLELVFVIVVLGILASLAMPRLERDLRQDAADNLLSAIRYTQHLALNDNKTDPASIDWQEQLWQIRFTGTTTLSYTIGSNTDGGTQIDKDESAIDPQNGKYLYNQVPTNPQNDESENIFITDKYGITNVTFTGCSNPAGTVLTTRHIAFDNFGRPFRGVGNAGNNYDRYMHQDCNITFTSNDAFPGDPIVITISQESGYATIVDQEDL